MPRQASILALIWGITATSSVLAVGNVAVIDNADPPATTEGELWCDFLVDHGFSCTLFPRTGPTGPLDPFDTVVDLSTTWSDPNGSLADFMRAGKTVVTCASAPIALRVYSNPVVSAWMGANDWTNGFDYLTTIATDPILGSLPVGTQVGNCLEPCTALTDPSGHPGAKVLATFTHGGTEETAIGILRNVWEGGVAVYLAVDVCRPYFSDHPEIPLNAVRARELTIPAVSTWGVVILALALLSAGTCVLRKRMPMAVLVPVFVWAALGSPARAGAPVGPDPQYDIKLRFAEGQPETIDALAPPMLRADPGSEMFIVQFVARPRPEFRWAVRELGAKLYHPAGGHAYLARMTEPARDAATSLPFVRSITPFHPAYRVQPSLLPELVGGVSTGETRRYSILVLERGGAQQRAVADRIIELGGTVHWITERSSRFEASMTIDQLAEIIRMDEVVFVDVPGEIGLDMDVVREVSGANYVESIGGFLGQGVRGEVFDTYLREDHVAFQHDDGPILHGPYAGLHDHGTKVFGVVFGNGLGDDPPDDAAKRGMLPHGTGIFADSDRLTDDPPLIRYEHTSRLVNDECCAGYENCPYNAVFQTNSFGHTETTDYTTVSKGMDEIAFDLDLLICQSQGNNGSFSLPETSRMSRPEAWGKNVLSVGGLRHFDNDDRADDEWCRSTNFHACNTETCPWCDPSCEPCDAVGCACESGRTCSSCGETACGSIGPPSPQGPNGEYPDERIKPDLVHFTDCVRTTHFLSDTAYTTDPPRHFGGTSAATPIVCGHAGLVFQMWHEEVFPGFGGGASVFADRPHATTVKAMLINTAYRYPLSSEGTDFTRYTQGWGFPDLAALYADRNSLFIVNETDLLVESGTKSYTTAVASGDPAPRVTLVYADPPPLGSPPFTNVTVNDLSLKVVSPSGAVYWGNYGLIDSNWSSPDPASSEENKDPYNTVENVFVQNPQAGTWTITVIADSLAQDGHVETPQEDADYALVIYPWRGRCCHGAECAPDGRMLCTLETQGHCDGYWEIWDSDLSCDEPCPWCPFGPAP